jgi:rod shape determining protein RodA
MFGLSLLVMLVPCGLVFLEPDLGTAIVYGFAWLSILVVAGARLIQIGLVLGVILAAVLLVFNVLPSAGFRVLQPYQQQRITSFLDPSGSSEAAYQSNQAKIAIGSGGLSGKGENGATVAKAGFLPERHTDFIFAVVGEQRGFVGAAFLLCLYVLIVWRAARAITLAATLYESLIAAGIFGMWIVQIFVNIGMTLGIMPTTGIPLPFMTYGGSNTITNLVACGLLLAIQVRGAVPEAPPLADHAVVRSRTRWSTATGD